MKLLTTGDLARLAGVDRHTITREIERGCIRATRRWQGSQWRIEQAEAERWLEFYSEAKWVRSHDEHRQVRRGQR